MRQVLVLCGLAAALLMGTAHGDSFTVSSCGDASQALVKVNKFDYSPKPISFPANLTVDVEFELLQDIVSPISVNSVIEVSANGKVMQIPCMNGFGSCFISDLCKRLATTDCPPFLKAQGIACECPFNQGTISLSGLKMYIPLGDTKGEFHVRVEVYTNNVFAFCLDILAIDS